MQLGFFMMPLHPPEKSRTECFAEDLEFVVHADELGFTEGWIGQHHTLEWEPIPSNDVFIAYCLPQTKNIRLGQRRLDHSPAPSGERCRASRVSRSSCAGAFQLRLRARGLTDRLGAVRFA